MRGVVEVDRSTGEVTSQISQVEGAGLAQLTEDQINQIGSTLTHIMQDANQLMRFNGGEADLGHLQRISLKLDEHHFVNIVASETKIKAHVDSIKQAEAH